jgi:hypothetical protein
MDRNFHFDLEEKVTKKDDSDAQLYCLDAKSLITPTECAQSDRRVQVRKAIMQGASLLSVRPLFGFVAEYLMDALANAATSDLIKLLKKGELLIIMDSIDAFMSAASHGKIGSQPRVLLKAVCDFLRFGPAGQRPNPGNTLLLTGEYHYHAPSPTPAFTESFFCDTEILLRPEPVCVPEDYEQHIQSSVGYSLNALIHEGAKSIESRSFCRVLKSRASANQSRRCAYDIVPTKGIQFFETYPGDGKIILFAENEPQRTAWNSFFERDVPDSYPALRNEVFDRMSMQSVYEGQRRLRNIPLKTDMYLSSFDSYWVGWYRSFKLKCDLHNALEPLLKSKPDQQQYCRFVNSLVHAFRIGMPDIKGASSKPKVRAQQAKSVIKKMNEIVDLSMFEEFLKASYSKRGKRHLEAILERLIRQLLEPTTPFATDYSCFLQRLPFRELRLFGEKRSGILPELIEARKPFRGQEWIKKAKKSCGKETKPSEIEWLAVPYDASVGFFVYRKDILHGSRKQFNREKVKTRLEELVKSEQRLMIDFCEDVADKPELYSQVKDCRKRASGHVKLGNKLKNALPFRSDIKRQNDDYEKCVEKVIQWACDRILEGEEPKTWEEVIVQCEMLDKKLLIETQRFDSYMSTLLEMVWNCGGELKVRPDYLIENKHELYVPMLRALHLLDTFFDTEIVDRNSTVSPYQSDSLDRRSGDEWLFARHWHSTLITYLTAKDESGGYLTTASPGAALEIMPIPVSLSRWVDYLYGSDQELRDQALRCPKPYQFMQKCIPHDKVCRFLSKKRKCKDPEFRRLLAGPDHHSCWGEWSLGLLAGSENRTLAIDLINNIMGSIKVISRAFSGACVPTVTAFYDMFGDNPCVHLPVRTDVTMPGLTYNDFRDKFFKYARTRNDIYDFMHCAKIFYGQVEFLRRTKYAEEKVKNEDLIKRCDKIIKNIESLYNEPILISPQY